MQSIRTALAASVVALSTFAAVSANAQVTVYEDRLSWETATGNFRTIDFSTTDAGTPITSPAADAYFGSLVLKGNNFTNIQSYMNDFIYQNAQQVVRVYLAPGTTAFGMDIKSYWDIVGYYTISLSTGDVITKESGTVYGVSEYIGFTSPTPIEWVDLSLSNSLMKIDNFEFVAPDPVRVVPLDIVPGSTQNAVKPNKGNVTVAVLSSASFNATTAINVGSVRFGATGTEAPVIRYTFKDVNGDKLRDLVMDFNMSQTGIACKMTTAKLTGKTVTGQSISGTDSIRTGCK